MTSARITVTVPAELLAEAQATNPDLSPSALLQDALRRLAACPHDELRCAHCGTVVRAADVFDRAMTRLYSEIQGLIADQARRGGTVEGLARRVRALGIAHHLRFAAETTLPVLTRAERRSAKVRDFPQRPAPAKAAAAKRPAARQADETG
jgi:hypothetical protein